MMILTGGDSVAVASVAHFGASDGTATPLAGSNVVNGGASTDSPVFEGPASRHAVSALADGSTRIADTTGAPSLSMLRGIERLRFGDAEAAAPGQTAPASAFDLAPIGRR